MAVREGWLGLVALAVAGCQGTPGPLAGRSPAGIPITVDAIHGVPEPVKAALSGELAEAATRRRVELVGTGAQARYRLKGHLTTETTAEGGTALAFVFDVYDGEKRRARRISGSSPIKTAGGDPWSGLDKETLARLAAESMDEIARFLVVADASPLSAASPSPETPAFSPSE
jgi:hypothetical protein